jgi:hypothetical protein
VIANGPGSAEQDWNAVLAADLLRVEAGLSKTGGTMKKILLILSFAITAVALAGPVVVSDEVTTAREKLAQLQRHFPPYHVAVLEQKALLQRLTISESSPVPLPGSLAAARRKLAQLQAHFTPQHPAVIEQRVVVQRLANEERERAAADSHLARKPLAALQP